MENEKEFEINLENEIMERDIYLIDDRYIDKQIEILNFGKKEMLFLKKKLMKKKGDTNRYYYCKNKCGAMVIKDLDSWKIKMKRDHTEFCKGNKISYYEAKLRCFKKPFEDLIRKLKSFDKEKDIDTKRSYTKEAEKDFYDTIRIVCDLEPIIE